MSEYAIRRNRMIKHLTKRNTMVRSKFMNYVMRNKTTRKTCKKIMEDTIMRNETIVMNKVIRNRIKKNKILKEKEQENKKQDDTGNIIGRSETG